MRGSQGPSFRGGGNARIHAGNMQAAGAKKKRADGGWRAVKMNRGREIFSRPFRLLANPSSVRLHGGGTERRRLPPLARGMQGDPAKPWPVGIVVPSPVRWARAHRRQRHAVGKEPT